MGEILLKGPPQEQIEGALALIVEAGGDVNVTQEGIHPQEHAAIVPQAAKGGIAALLPDIARLERNSEVGRHVQISRATPANLLIENRAGNGEMGPGNRIGLEAGQVQEPSQREQ